MDDDRDGLGDTADEPDRVDVPLDVEVPVSEPAAEVARLLTDDAAEDARRVTEPGFGLVDNRFTRVIVRADW